MIILVTDGDSRASLAIVRSLGAKGHRVIVGSPRGKSLASSSKFCHAAVQYSDPKTGEREFFDSLLKIIATYKVEALIPVTDISVFTVSACRSEIPDSCVIPLPSAESLSHAANKGQLLETARRLGVATPKSILIHDLNDYRERSSELEFPLVIKPSRSRVRVEGGWVSTSVDYAKSEKELLNLLQSLDPAAFPVLLQERISGPGIGLFYCFDGGRPVAKFAHKRLREKPPSGGVSVLRESVAPHKLADEFGAALLHELSWRGVAMVEFKLDERDGLPKLMEINGRFWGSLQLAIDSGVDFPCLLLSVFKKEQIDPIRNYRLGVRSRWLWGDIDLFLMYLLKSSSSLKLPDNSEPRFLSAMKILVPWVRGQQLEILRLSDFGPWIHETLSRFRR